MGSLQRWYLRERRVGFWVAVMRGLSTVDAARVAGVSVLVGTRWFRENGGMSPICLAPVSGRYLSFGEREELAVLRAAGFGVRESARRLGRDAGTVSRELRRNSMIRAGQCVYRATSAQQQADRRSCRPKVAKLATHHALRSYVEDRLAGLIETPWGMRVRGPEVTWTGRDRGRAKRRRRDRRWASAWSPKQIASRLPVDFPDDVSMRISHETIYQSLYVQGRGALRRELTACLRTGRAVRLPHARTRAQRTPGYITPEIMISERPAEANDRAVPGHWEGDLIIGSNSSAIGTLVERASRYLILLHLPRTKGTTGHTAEAVRNAITTMITQLPADLRQTLTWDQGVEMSQHPQLRIDTGLDIYFCDPKSPWQRGTNENTNGLLRQYFPKGTDLNRHSPTDLAAVAHALNTRPRATLQYRTPRETLTAYLNSQEQNSVATTP